MKHTRKLLWRRVLISFVLCMSMFFIACSNSSSSSSDDDEDLTVSVKDFSLYDISHEITEAVRVMTPEQLANLKDGDVITITVKPSLWTTTDGDETTWYCYSCGKSGDEDYLGDIDEWAPNGGGWVSKKITVTAEMVSKLKSGGLWVYGNNKNAKLTVELTSIKSDDEETKPEEEKKEEEDNVDDKSNDTSNNNNSDNNTVDNGATPSGAITTSGIDYAKLKVGVKESESSFANTFVRGFDVSTVYAIENAGMEYLDADGTKADVFAQLKAVGVNTVRIRVWNDPSKDADDAAKKGGNNVDVAKNLAKRAVDAGMDYMIDFHFSDTWADPVTQKCPDAWKDISDPSEMAAAIATFVEDSLNAINTAAGKAPSMVQLGNECESGILLTNCAAAVKATAGSDNFKNYLNAAAAKVRSAASGAKIVLHTSRGGNSTVVQKFIENTAGIDFDYIGLSYYPFFTSHNNLEGLKSCIGKIKEAGKEAIIAETSFCWTCNWDGDKCDTENNQLWYYTGDGEGLVQAAKSLVDASGNLVMGLTTTTCDGKTVIAPTVQNQYNAVAAVMEAANAAGALGVFYWGGDWITNKAASVPSAMENQAFWNYDHKILDSAAVFSYGTAESNTAAGNLPEVTYPTSVTVKGAWDDWATEIPLTSNGAGVYTGEVTTNESYQNFGVYIDGIYYGDDGSEAKNKLSSTVADAKCWAEGGTGKYSVTVDCTDSTYTWSTTLLEAIIVYPYEIYVYSDSNNWASSVATLSKTGTEGTYSGTLPSHTSAQNFKIVVNGTWYGYPADDDTKSKLDSSEGAYKFWVDQNKSASITVDLTAMTCTFTTN